MQPRPPRPRSSFVAPPVRARSYAASPALPPVVRPEARTAGRRFVLSPRVASATLVIVGIFVIGGLGFWRATTTAQPTLPIAVAQQLSFGVYFPTTHTKLATIDSKTIRYQAGSGLLGYTARLADGTTISVNQQATPVSFVDIPQAYDRLVTSLQPYTSFESVNGRVSLTHPKELRGSQSAVMNAKGTLLFARPSKNLSDRQWRQLFNGLFADQIPAAK